MAERPPPRLLTRKELAEALGRHPMGITKLEQQGMPIAERGTRGRPSRYNLAACIQWLIDRDVAARGGNGSALDPAQERALLDQRRREEIEQRMAIKSGRYVLLESVERTWATHIVTAKNALLGLPHRFKLLLPNVSQTDLSAIDHEIRAVLEELADGVVHLPPAPLEEIAS